MPRNIERDEKEAMRRKEQLMEAGFRHDGGDFLLRNMQVKLSL